MEDDRAYEHHKLEAEVMKSRCLNPLGGAALFLRERLCLYRHPIVRQEDLREATSEKKMASLSGKPFPQVLDFYGAGGRN